MAYCGPRGIPLSAFLSWPAPDQEAALAWQQVEASRCKGCGTSPADWDESDGGDRRAWMAVPHECPGCSQVQLLQSSDTVQGVRGMSVRLVRPEVIARGYKNH